MNARILVVIGPALIGSAAKADVAEFADKQAWQSAVGGNYSTIDFTGFPDGTPISDQYQDVGVTFTGSDFTFASAFFVNDGWGLHGPAGIHFNFDSPQNWVSVDFPGAVRFQLFSQGALIYTSTFFQPGGTGNFAGLVSTVSFDEVYLYKTGVPNIVFVDDLHWGTPLPAPGVFAIFALGALRGRRARRC